MAQVGDAVAAKVSNLQVSLPSQLSRWRSSWKNGGLNGWFVRENPIEVYDLGLPLFQETPKWIQMVFCPPK